MDEAKYRPPSTPKGLEMAGRRMWRKVTKGYLLRADELILLESACKTADIVTRLEAAMHGQPLMVKGSMGQMREHPLLSEARQQRALLTRVIAQLKLPDDEANVPGAADRSIKARKAAATRWGTGG